MDIVIRKGLKKDLPDVLKLIKELAIYENAEKEVNISLKDLENDGFGKHPYFWFLIAEKNKKVIGLSFYFIRYSTWKGSAMHLEDLIVTEKHRGKGIGFALFSKFIKYSYNQKVNRVQWVVLDWNQSAIEFYKNNGAQVLNDWRVALMDKNAIKKFVENESI